MKNWKETCHGKHLFLLICKKESKILQYAWSRNFRAQLDLNQTTTKQNYFKVPSQKSRASVVGANFDNLPSCERIWLYNNEALSTTPNLFWKALRDSCFHSFAKNIKGWFVEQHLFSFAWLCLLSMTNTWCLHDSQSSFLLWLTSAHNLCVPAQKNFWVFWWNFSKKNISSKRAPDSSINLVCIAMKRKTCFEFFDEFQQVVSARQNVLYVYPRKNVMYNACDNETLNIYARAFAGWRALGKIDGKLKWRLLMKSSYV